METDPLTKTSEKVARKLWSVVSAFRGKTLASAKHPCFNQSDPLDTDWPEAPDTPHLTA